MIDVTAMSKDQDGDGYLVPADCDDGNPQRYPTAQETPDNGVDEDCNGVDATDLDRDRDGFQRPLDCDDGNRAVRPGATEQPGNTVDENCDGKVDPWPRLTGVKVTWSASAGAKSTTLRRLVVEGAPRGAKVTGSCKGAGCPRKPVRLTVKSASVKLSAYVGRRLRPRTTVTIRVEHVGHVTAVAVMKIRSGRLPVVNHFCQAPGQARPSSCA